MGVWFSVTPELPISVAARSKARVCRVACWDCWFGLLRECGCLHLVSVVCFGRGRCDRLITRPEKSYRVWRVWVWFRSPGKAGRNPELGQSATGGGVYINNRGKGQGSRFTGFESHLDIRYPEWRFCVVFLRRSYSSSLSASVMSVLVHGADIFKSCVELGVHLQQLK